MREDTRTLVFAGVTCIVVSLLLSVTASVLKPAQQANEAFDVKRNIVKAFGIDISSLDRPGIEASFEKHVAKDKAGDLPIFTWTDEGADKASKYAFPISGKGLWSMLYGYLSLEADLETIAGISFYKHGETPGLGAEIEKPWFLSQFTGKKLYNEGTAVDFLVVKPGTPPTETSVDGISGATLTGKGVQALIQKDAAAYAEYFKSIKGN
ncbi:NADH:ubiquinone reductase (Na(+)-transporting) subunit C [Pontiella sulfatireligans]|uniref:Na(+)-translocating NADH-quinone reductase subunit C n=1 Tax=Pontiella sulfatireligans TaxID=2750658 RepID=A0A6C2UCW2_9BACT|nr:NADH:ubiquinone reductase (Na(+)-transporting) subunit C [Pontiella sulfatireligans]VGO17955.1 Na(+)-translocating NADH-quinone reductase subunit C [Pontiella sulfatireligans]